MGFDVELDVAGFPTAFVASYRSGKPVTGFLTHYDALPGLSQEDTPHQKARVDGGAKHTCGHNLISAGVLGSGSRAKKGNGGASNQGTIRFFGCPAEEAVGGKLYMARDGVFDDLDAGIAWHPDYETYVNVKGAQAIDEVEIEFKGKASHAAVDPWMGASALDAVEMTTFGINLLREHITISSIPKGTFPTIAPTWSAFRAQSRSPRWERSSPQTSSI